MFFIFIVKLVSALALSSTLIGLVLAGGPRSQCEEIYNTAKGDTCNSIAQGQGIDSSVITSLNPGVDCSSALPIDQKLCTKSYVPECTRDVPATSTTCDGLADQWNITKTQFIAYNDNVNDDCSNLIITQLYCVSLDGCQGNKAPICQQG